jgi:hypothetical protein
MGYEFQYKKENIRQPNFSQHKETNATNSGFYLQDNRPKSILQRKLMHRSNLSDNKVYQFAGLDEKKQKEEALREALHLGSLPLVHPLRTRTAKRMIKKTPKSSEASAVAVYHHGNNDTDSKTPKRPTYPKKPHVNPKVPNTTPSKELLLDIGDIKNPPDALLPDISESHRIPKPPKAKKQIPTRNTLPEELPELERVKTPTPPKSEKKPFPLKFKAKPSKVEQRLNELIRFDKKKTSCHSIQ